MSSTVVPLASGSVVNDSVTVELIRPLESPAVVRITWPMAATVMTPERFAAASLSVVGVMDRALHALAETHGGDAKR
jgi:hypothetical protein